jgi:hypothetical protein
VNLLRADSKNILREKMNSGTRENGTDLNPKKEGCRTTQRRLKGSVGLISHVARVAVESAVSGLEMRILLR